MLMIRCATAVAVSAAALSLAGSAWAGPCSTEIGYFEQAVRQSRNIPYAGPFLPQTVGAQLGYQPTPASIKQANARAWTIFNATLRRAKRLDARGDGAGCTRELAAAKRMYNM